MHGKIYSQELQTSLFQEVNQSMQTANHAQADVLSPRTYNKAMDEYNAAQKKYADAGDLSDIRSHIYTANSKFQEATENTKVSSVMFTNALSARRDAISAVAVLYAKNIWEDAEKKMKDAAEELEKGDADDAKEEAVKATDLYRKAELESIKANYLSNAKNLLKKVDDDKVYKVSPKTSKQAQSLVNEVEKELIENRYDTDNARYLAKEAEYQAKLAMYIAKQEKIMDKQDFSHEDYLLLSYEPIAQIGESFQLNLRFDQGVDGPVSQIKGRIGADQQRIAILEASLYNEKVKSSNLQGILKEQEIILADLEGTLSDEALKGQKRQAILQNRIDRQNEINAKFEQVQQIFTADEAQVFRQKDYVIIRMIGINFEVGKSQIKEEDYNQLTKLQKAMSLFLNASIVIEGHTDSQGGDTDNLKLSQERADAVLSYLSANTTINKGRFSTRGFGESKPVANNETLGGRKLNRRIDIIIIPNLNTMMPGTVAPSIN
jgi:outer membrane protein OmpA-like peptidoglycan-associated protein/HEPN domain-containing protein